MIAAAGPRMIPEESSQFPSGSRRAAAAEVAVARETGGGSNVCERHRDHRYQCGADSGTASDE